ncbi:hypothetical protein P691DRAFT_21702 [Macrolepiota fuliginosa MF-IS2]|uniref:Uncharacterized protein n=1 Tax=Macrolepiota fuliginosa MF-IS2 TaxID=1400762 RepID=A0A9P6C936_9AGAR|nr:hypothetical protein P691DRAFT_21702 [Macrolepiota fuliginosa MF-IS2]
MCRRIPVPGTLRVCVTSLGLIHVTASISWLSILILFASPVLCISPFAPSNPVSNRDSSAWGPTYRRAALYLAVA